MSEQNSPADCNDTFLFQGYSMVDEIDIHRSDNCNEKFFQEFQGYFMVDKIDIHRLVNITQ